jgi:hypothetical protein
VTHRTWIPVVWQLACGPPPADWVGITSAGRAALAAEVDALAELVRRHRG